MYDMLIASKELHWPYPMTFSNKKKLSKRSSALQWLHCNHLYDLVQLQKQLWESESECGLCLAIVFVLWLSLGFIRMVVQRISEMKMVQFIMLVRYQQIFILDFLHSCAWRWCNKRVQAAADLPTNKQLVKPDQRQIWRDGKPFVKWE